MRLPVRIVGLRNETLPSLSLSHPLLAPLFISFLFRSRFIAILFPPREIIIEEERERERESRHAKECEESLIVFDGLFIEEFENWQNLQLSFGIEI